MAKGKTKRAAVRRDERCPPTAETVAKLVPDSLGCLSPDYQHIAMEIGQTYRLLTRIVAGRVADPGHVGKGHEYEMTDEQAALYTRYKRWIDELGRRKIPHLPMLNMIVDGVQAWQIDQRRRWQPGRAGELLFEALEIYRRLPTVLTKAAKHG